MEKIKKALHLKGHKNAEEPEYQGTSTSSYSNVEHLDEHRGRAPTNPAPTNLSQPATTTGSSLSSASNPTTSLTNAATSHLSAPGATTTTTTTSGLAAPGATTAATSTSTGSNIVSNVANAALGTTGGSSVAARQPMAAPASTSTTGSTLSNTGSALASGLQQPSSNIASSTQQPITQTSTTTTGTSSVMSPTSGTKGLLGTPTTRGGHPYSPTPTGPAPALLTGGNRIMSPSGRVMSPNSPSRWQQQNAQKSQFSSANDAYQSILKNDERNWEKTDKSSGTYDKSGLSYDKDANSTFDKTTYGRDLENKSGLIDKSGYDKSGSYDRELGTQDYSTTFNNNNKSGQALNSELAQESSKKVVNAPVQIVHKENPAVVKETIHPYETIEVQPVIVREREQLEVRQITEQIHETRIMPTLTEEIQAPAQYMGQVKANEGITRDIPPEETGKLQSGTERMEPIVERVVKAPIVHERIIKKIVEEVQPVIYRDIVQPEKRIVQRPMFEHVMDLPLRGIASIPAQRAVAVQPLQQQQPQQQFIQAQPLQQQQQFVQAQPIQQQQRFVQAQPLQQQQFLQQQPIQYGERGLPQQQGFVHPQYLQFGQPYYQQGGQTFQQQQQQPIQSFQQQPFQGQTFQQQQQPIQGQTLSRDIGLAQPQAQPLEQVVVDRQEPLQQQGQQQQGEKKMFEKVFTFHSQYKPGQITPGSR